MAEKTAVLSPMPSARVITTTAVKTGLLTRMRRANRRSCRTEGMAMTVRVQDRPRPAGVPTRRVLWPWEFRNFPDLAAKRLEKVN